MGLKRPSKRQQRKDAAFAVKRAARHQAAEAKLQAKAAQKAARKAASRRSKNKNQPVSQRPEPLAKMSVAERSRFYLPPPPDPLPESHTSRRHRLNPNAITSFAELSAALSAKKVQLTLAADIIVPENIVISYDVAINLNGHSLISEQSARDMRVLDIRRGDVVITGKGNIFAMGRNGVAVRVFGAISSGLAHYTRVTIDEQVRLFAPEGSGILIAPNLGAAYGVEVNFAGEIVGRDGICLAPSVRGRERNRPRIRVRSGSQIIADEERGVALDAAGIGVWEVGATKIFSSTGILAHFGKFWLSHAQIVAGRPAILLEGDEPGELSVEIDGGVYLSEHSLVIVANPPVFDHFWIKSGEFCGLQGVANRELTPLLTVAGGNFRSDLETCLMTYAPRIENEDEVPAGPSTDMMILPVPATIMPATTPNSMPLPPAPAATPAEVPTPAPTIPTPAVPEPVTAPAPVATPAPTPIPKPIPKPMLDSMSEPAPLASVVQAIEPTPRPATESPIRSQPKLEPRSKPKPKLARKSKPMPKSKPEPEFAELTDLELDELFAGTEPTSIEPTKEEKPIFDDPATLVDDFSPLAFWSTGVTSIDEAQPLLHIAIEPARATKAHTGGGLTRFLKGLVAGFRAGSAAFVEASQEAGQ